jgi:ATP-dependent RNA helicase DeaD
MKTFEEIGLLDDVLNAIGELGFQKPTPIQEKTIPHMLDSNQDIIASAQTGTGKTAAFGLPIVQLTKREDKRTQTLILCPTRELCIQITKDMTNYSKYLKMYYLKKIMVWLEISRKPDIVFNSKNLKNIGVVY